MIRMDGSPGENCPICHKPPKDRKEWYVGTFGYREAGFPWIPSSHKLCQLRRFPKDLFWLFITLTVGAVHSLIEGDDCYPFGGSGWNECHRN